MKISKLVTYLNKCKKENGDLEIKIIALTGADKEEADVAGVVTIMNDDDAPQYAMICDDEGLDILL